MKKKEEGKGKGREGKRALRTEIVTIDKIPKLKDPILIEGLPGIGFVGKLAAEHLVEELKAKKIAELYSHHFPHQVFINKDGTIRMLSNEIYLWLDPKKRHDLIIIVGDVQPVSSEAQYEVMSVLLNFFESLDGKLIFTLGGYSVGRISEKPRVFATVTDKKMVEEYKKYGVVFGATEGSIVGAAGLLLGLGKMRDIKGVCFMGETHGNYVDHRSAQNILNVLSQILGININMEKLAQKAKESEVVIRRIEEETKKVEGEFIAPPPKKPEDLTYIR